VDGNCAFAKEAIRSRSASFLAADRAPGLHCDVGDGYPEAESAAREFPLQWMQVHATRAQSRQM
jgi:hypothetical protein